MQDQWSKVASMYKAYFENDNRVSNRVVFKRIIDFINNYNQKKILDFGCGQGRFARYFSNLGAKVWAYDISDEQIRFAKEFDDKQEIFYTTHKKEIYYHNYYDLILCFMVLLCNPLSNMIKIIKDINQMINENGICIFVNTNTETLGNKFLDFYSINTNDLIDGDSYSTIIPTHSGDIIVTDYYYSSSYLDKVFLENNFKIINKEVIADQFLLHVLCKA